MKALFVIDMLKDFMSEEIYGDAKLPVEPSKEIVDEVEEAVKIARENEVRVFYVNDAHEEGDEEFEEWSEHCMKGTEGAEVLGRIAPRGNDYVIEKKTHDGFSNSKLNGRLQELNVGEIYEVGVVTDICVLETGKTGVEHGYDMKAIREAVSGLEERDGGLEDLEDAGIEVVSLEEYRDALL